MDPQWIRKVLVGMCGLSQYFWVAMAPTPQFHHRNSPCCDRPLNCMITGASLCGMLSITLFTAKAGLPDEDVGMLRTLTVYPLVMEPEGKVTLEISAQSQEELSNGFVKKLNGFFGKYSNRGWITTPDGVRESRS